METSRQSMYLLMKNPNSQYKELHIFEMKFIRVDEKGRSIYDFYPHSDKEERYKCQCKALEHGYLKYYEPQPKVYNENDIREKCAKIGRQVCGRCISTLYGDY